MVFTVKYQEHPNEIFLPPGSILGPSIPDNKDFLWFLFWIAYYKNIKGQFSRTKSFTIVSNNNREKQYEEANSVNLIIIFSHKNWKILQKPANKLFKDMPWVCDSAYLALAKLVKSWFQPVLVTLECACLFMSLVPEVKQ